MLNWGILGLGKIADTRVAPAFAHLRDSHLVAVAGRDPARTAAFAARHGGRPATVAALLADPAIDAVYVAAPNDLHETYTVAAARAGKHVLCEKPLARDVAEAERMVAACAAAGVRLGTAFQMRYHPAHAQIRELVQQGALGQVRQARVQFAFELLPGRRTWRMADHAAGGPLFDVGSHCVDLLSYLTGQPIQAVSAVLRRQTFVEHPVEDAAILNLVLAGGALAQVNVAFNTPYAVTSLELHGSAGSVWTRGTLGQTPEGVAEMRDATGLRPLAWAPVDLYAAEIAVFAAAVSSKAPLEISGEAGLANLRALGAAVASARQGGGLVAVETGM